ncbi:MAG TPA: hypothetical protein P5121_20165 [Caldilineaceae bacterium]|nr:hypothetical protein [Caldilineaceae bacterium]
MAERAPVVPELTVYRNPAVGRVYMIGADSAEGDPTSDDSVGCVVDTQRWEQVVVLAGKIEPGTFAQQVAQTTLRAEDPARMALLLCKIKKLSGCKTPSQPPPMSGKGPGDGVYPIIYLFFYSNTFIERFSGNRAQLDQAWCAAS